MKTPYIPHTFGDEVERKLRSRHGWLTAGVATSIAWPSLDVCVQYADDEYFLRGSERDGKPSSPGITIACQGAGHADTAIAKIYRFTSVLSWFEGGYVDVAGYIWGSHPALYGARNVYSSLGIMGAKSFNCNYMPIIEDENVRKALAFWREGKRLYDVHDSYSFLSFFKVIECQFRDGRDRRKWIGANISKLEGKAAERAAELQSVGTDISTHLYESGRCAVAHASVDGEIVDPDIPDDKKRLTADLVIMEELARIYIRDELQVPTARSLYRTRDRLSPWTPLLSAETIQALRSGSDSDLTDLFSLEDRPVSVGLWPDGPIRGLKRLDVHVDAVDRGLVRLVMFNNRMTIMLVFVLDYTHGRAHIDLENSGVLQGDKDPDESDVRAYATLYYNVFCNSIVELVVDECEPVQCEVVIPVNMRMTMSPDEAVSKTIETFRKQQATDLQNNSAG